MGYDLTRFIGEVDEAFHCLVCMGVFENPLVSTCDHTFCRNCINGWLATNTNCPVDRCSLKFKDMKPPSRAFLSLLNKLEMKCNFETKGCGAVVKLENLKVHLMNCKGPEILCDKGCNLKITEHEYAHSNCLTHLKNRVSLQNKQLAKLNIQLKTFTIKASQNVTQNAQRNAPSMWRTCHNVFISRDELSILKYYKMDAPKDYGYAQSVDSLQLNNSSFKVQLLTGTAIVGLTCKEYPTTCRIGQQQVSIGLRCYPSGAYLFVNGAHNFTNLSAGKIIKCGITFPYNFVSNQDNYVEVYFYADENLIVEEVIKMPPDGLFPAINLLTPGSKIRYLSN